MSDEKPWANLGFAEEQAPFEGPTQKARFWTEAWVARSLFCPNCGAETISRFPANRRLADFECRACREEYELKAQKSRFGARVLDGAYGAKLQRLEAANNPNLMLMNYDAARLRVTDLIVVPKHFFTADIIEARKPLAAHARRAGWQGSRIRLDAVPLSGKIALVRDSILVPKETVLKSWRDTLFLRDQSLVKRSWLIEVSALSSSGSAAPPSRSTTSTPSSRILRASTRTTGTSAQKFASSCRCCATMAG